MAFLISPKMTTDNSQPLDYIFPLPLPVRPKQIVRDLRIFPGHRYRIETPPSNSKLGDLEEDLQRGLLGAYRLTGIAATIEAIDSSARPIRGFVWDADLLNPWLKQHLQIAPNQPRSAEINHLTLVDISTVAPEVRLLLELPTLCITPRFELEWYTGAHASQLGIVRLVESSRTALLANGDSVTLLDTETAGDGPVLLLEDAADQAIVKPVCGFQPQGERKRLEYSHTVSQTIPSEIDGIAIASISVLEKYTLYFMQNADPERPDRYIWVPVHLPIVWGWSIRVQQRYDGVWDIFRKKLIMPTPSTEAPALPRWQSNSLQCRGAVDI